MIEKLKVINEHPFRKNFTVSVDGGVNDNVIRSISAEKVISGSYVLNSSFPQNNIMRLQTSSRYEESQ